MAASAVRHSFGPWVRACAVAEWRRRSRTARKARNLAPAYWIDHLIRSGKVAGSAAVARMCGVGRARVTSVVGLPSASPPAARESTGVHAVDRCNAAFAVASQSVNRLPPPYTLRSVSGGHEPSSERFLLIVNPPRLQNQVNVATTPSSIATVGAHASHGQ